MKGLFEKIEGVFIHFLKKIASYEKWVLGAVFLLTSFTFYGEIHWVISDIPTHNSYLIEMVHGDLLWRPHFLYYLLLGSLTFFSENIQIINTVSIVLLSTLVIFKYYVSKRIFSNEIPSTHKMWAPVLLGLSLVFIFNLPPGYTGLFQKGQIPPNVWHNSTGILLAPVTLLTFYHSKRYLLDGIRDKREKFVLIGLTIANVCIKPVFILPFLVVFPLFSLFIIKPVSLRSFSQTLVIILPPVLGLILQYAFFYSSGASGRGIGIDPFKAWGLITDHYFLSLLLSIPFPLALIVIKGRTIRKSLTYWFGASLFIAAFLIYIIFIEKGQVAAQNFLKGAAQANMAYHLCSIMVFSKIWLKKEKSDLKDYFLLAILLLQVLVGIVNVIKIPFLGYK